MFEDLFRGDVTARGEWRVGDTVVAEEPPVPTLHLIAGDDRIVPAATAPEGRRSTIPSGHVGMVVGRAREHLQRELADFLRQ